MPNFLPILLVMGVFWFPALGQTDSTSRPNHLVHTIVDEPPRFPGNQQALTTYLKKNLRYPKAARKADLEGIVVVNFTVTDEGHIKDVNHFNSLGLGTDQEAIRLVANMPDWIPARKDGKAVHVRYNLQIRFDLD